MNALDTNVLYYAHDSSDPVKQQKSIDLIVSLADGALLWQVACEYLNASRKLEPQGYSRIKAWQDIRDLRRVWTTLLPSWSVLDRAQTLISAYSISFWDAMIVAASLEGGVVRLYTEDFGGQSSIEGLEIVNPFKEGAE
jgi:predicted nucleic acid-binding protein